MKCPYCEKSDDVTILGVPAAMLEAYAGLGLGS